MEINLPSTYLKIMADLLGVSTDYLPGRSDDMDGQVIRTDLAHDEQQLIDIYRSEGWLGLIRLGAERIAK